jgi:glyoxylate reductase
MSELADLIEPQSKCRKDFIEECKSGQLDGVLVTYRTFNSIEITGLFDEEIVGVLPDSLKFVCHNGKSKLKLSAKHP